MTTYMECNSVEVASVSADTLTTLATITIPALRGGTIKKIFVNYADVVNAKAASAYVTVEGKDGPHNYVVGGGNGGATDSSALMEAQGIPCEIPVNPSDIITIKIYSAEALVDAHAGILWE